MAWKQANKIQADPERRARLIGALARGETKSGAAREAGYSRVHVQKLCADPAFAAEVEAARRAQCPPGPQGEPMRARARSACEVGLATLREIMADPKAPATARVKAAETILRLFDRLAAEAKTEPVQAKMAPPPEPEPPDEDDDEGLSDHLDELEAAAQ